MIIAEEDESGGALGSWPDVQEPTSVRISPFECREVPEAVILGIQGA